jgi:fluoride exporter
MIMTLSQVALGGAAGAVARYLTVMAATRTFGPGFAFGTLLVNVAGSFAIGILFVVLAQRGNLSPLLMTGFLGGFTTFSAFSLDALKLWEAGQSAQALAYIAASVVLSLAAVALGAALARGAFA